MSPAARKLKQLRSEALSLAHGGEPRRALEKLTALESLEPNEPDWPRRAAECHRLLGDRVEMLRALARAASGYVGMSMVVKAMAICKMMLAIDPKHPAALDWMSKLERPLGIPPGASASVRATARRRLPTIKNRAKPSEPTATTSSESTELQTLVVQRGLVAVARAVARKTARLPRQHVEVKVDEAPAPAPRTRSGPSSGNWQVVDDIELLEAEAPEADESTEPDAPATLSLPPLSVDTELRRLVPGSISLPGGKGKPSGMFRLAIDAAPATPNEQALRQAREVLPAVPVFSEIDPSSLEGLIRQSRLLHLQPGETAVRQDDAPDCFYVIVNGSVAVVDQTAADVELYRLGENEFFGEAALISNEPCPTTVRAAEACDLMAFDREAMRVCIANNPAVVPVLLRFVRSRMIEHLVRVSPLFTHFETAERRALTRKFELIEFADGAQLLQQGTRSPGIFVLLSGAVDVTQLNDQREDWLATLERGGVFGEMSLLSRPTAVADVRAVSPGFALMLPAAAFREVIMTHPPFLEVLTLLSEEREQANQRRCTSRDTLAAR